MTEPFDAIELALASPWARCYRRGVPTQLDEAETQARLFAVARHGAQLYGDKPYVVHLEAVRDLVVSTGHGDLAVAAWLHDTLEDTATRKDDLVAGFGPRVAELVWAVTGVGISRADRNRDAYAKIRALPAACNLKLCDRIANVEAAGSAPAKLAMYRREMDGFAAALDGLGDPALWRRLQRALDAER
jgi:(p)ppGpp synthase/HD superfamily hydrolase